MRALVVVAALALAACVGEVQDRSSRGIKPIVNGTESPEDESVDENAEGGLDLLDGDVLAPEGSDDADPVPSAE